MPHRFYCPVPLQARQTLDLPDAIVHHAVRVLGAAAYVAEGAEHIIASHATRNFVVEDTVVINLRFANGALGSFVLSDTAASARSWEQTSQENKSYPTFEDEDCYHIAGSQGSLSIPTMRLKRFEEGTDRSWWQPMSSSVLPLQREDPLALQIRHFAQLVRGQVQPRVSARDGLQNLRVTEAIVQAAFSSGVVEIQV